SRPLSLPSTPPAPTASPTLPLHDALPIFIPTTSSPALSSAPAPPSPRPSSWSAGPASSSNISEPIGNRTCPSTDVLVAAPTEWPRAADREPGPDGAQDLVRAAVRAAPRARRTRSGRGPDGVHPTRGHEGPVGPAFRDPARAQRPDHGVELLHRRPGRLRGDQADHDGQHQADRETGHDLVQVLVAEQAYGHIRLEHAPPAGDAGAADHAHAGPQRGQTAPEQ